MLSFTKIDLAEEGGISRSLITSNKVSDLFKLDLTYAHTHLCCSLQQDDLNSKMPVVNVGNKANPNYLPVEVCVVLPRQSTGEKLDPDQTASMIRYAVRQPWMNATSITQEGPPLSVLTQI